MVAVDRIQGLSGALAIKAPVLVATTANITLSGEQTIDGVAVVDGDRVLVKDQTDTTENGIYEASTGTWERSPDFDGVNDVVDGTIVLVTSGTVSAGMFFDVSGTNPITPGTSAITIAQSNPFAGVLGVTAGGTGRATGTSAYALVATGTTATGTQQSLAVGATTEMLVGGGASALPVWTAATGSGAPVRATSPTLVTPVLGVATATSINKVAFTQPATGATVTIADGKTFTASNSLTLAGTDGTTMTFPSTSASVARTDAAQTFSGVQDFDGRIDANAGLTVSGAAFTSRGITDSATATALTLSGSGANSITIANSATNPTIGTSAGGLLINPAGQGLSLAVFTGGASTVNYLSVAGGVSGTAVTVLAAGSDANVNMSLQSKGSGTIFLSSDSGAYQQAAVIHTASANRYITLTGSNNAAPAIGTSAGDLALSPATGIVSFGTHSAKGAEAFTGYITIKDSAGNSRKVMVCS